MCGGISGKRWDTLCILLEMWDTGRVSPRRPDDVECILGDAWEDTSPGCKKGEAGHKHHSGACLANQDATWEHGLGAYNPDLELERRVFFSIDIITDTMR